MSNPTEREAEDLYEAENDPSRVSGSGPDSSYVAGTKRGEPVSVQGDDAPVEDPMQPPFSNTDQQLERDEQEAVDKSNILKGDRTRHAKPQTASGYNEGPNEDDLPAEVTRGDTGQSSMRGL
ncbi:hypothetical protein AJ80_05976 [Polytolypa hystricis UAMH7299]|uniref:Histone chaperone domain-containing protein n=1 Tax=Polytolypa hystricis (strain UAMH7299) TaxID=1447883 RepID=A0A2B7XYV3_POLH7|nr:hypothetical protein AJ80_05976 [Polytolypa hystricis UAMH7299]